MSSSLKRHFIFVILIFLLPTACKTQNEQPSTDAAPSETIISSTPPFQTKEPQRYQATRTITITGDEKTLVTTTSTARIGDRRRQESEMYSRRVVHLDLPEGRFILFPDEKIYAEVTGGFNTLTDDVIGITAEWLLHEDTSVTSYQKLGKEVVAGRNATKYKTIVNISNAENVTQSETLIWIDEALNMPIKSETTSTRGPRVTMELSSVTLDVDARLLQVPNDYEKVAIGELRRRLMPGE